MKIQVSVSAASPVNSADKIKVGALISRFSFLNDDLDDTAKPKLYESIYKIKKVSRDASGNFEEFVAWLVPNPKQTNSPPSNITVTAKELDTMLALPKPKQLRDKFCLRFTTKALPKGSESDLRALFELNRRMKRLTLERKALIEKIEKSQ